MPFQSLVINDLRGGRNGVDPPLGLRPTECAEAVNVDWYGSTIGRKRGGSDSVAMTGATLTGTVSALFRHVPTTDETLAELYAVDDATTPILNRLAGGTTWSALALADPPTGHGWDFQAASLNGKLFLAYQTSGLNATPSAPTVANTGSGSYAATARQYRIRWITIAASGMLVKRSPTGDPVGFTPSGSGTAARVTRPTAPGVGETHWELEGSPDGVTFYTVHGFAFGNHLLIATTTTDDTTPPSGYSAFPQSGIVPLRLHCYDPVAGAVRRASLPTPAAPFVANSASAGTYAATLGYWRVRWVQIASGVTVRRSEPSPSAAFTPDGSHIGVTITQPVIATEGETHWEIEFSTDNVTFYVVYGDTGFTTAQAIGSTTAPVANTTAVLLALGLSPKTGTYTALPAAKYLAADQNRLLMFGDYTTTNPQNRITISSVVGSLNVGDAERVDTTASWFIDLDENDSGVPTGLVGPVDGNFYAFKYRQVWRLTPSGTPQNPYTQKCLSKHIGCVGPRAMVVAEDEAGRPAVYWMSHRGPYRYGAAGLEYLGRGVEDLLLRGAPNSSAVMNLAATKVVSHAVYHEDKRQVWFWTATGSSNDPDQKLIYSIGRVQGPSPSDTPVASGWARHTGPSAAARCAVMFSRTIGAAMSFDLKPYIGQTSAAATIYSTDSTTTTDAGTPFQSYVQAGAYAPWGLGQNGLIGRGHLLATAQSGVTLTQTLSSNFGTEVATSAVDLTPASTETRVFPTFEDAAASAYACQPQWGDASAVAAAWSIEAVVIDWKPSEAR